MTTRLRLSAAMALSLSDQPDAEPTAVVTTARLAAIARGDSKLPPAPAAAVLLQRCRGSRLDCRRRRVRPSRCRTGRCWRAQVSTERGVITASGNSQGAAAAAAAAAGKRRQRTGRRRFTDTGSSGTAGVRSLPCISLTRTASSGELLFLTSINVVPAGRVWSAVAMARADLRSRVGTDTLDHVGGTAVACYVCLSVSHALFAGVAQTVPVLGPSAAHV